MSDTDRLGDEEEQDVDFEDYLKDTDEVLDP